MIYFIISTFCVYLFVIADECTKMNFKPGQNCPTTVNVTCTHRVNPFISINSILNSCPFNTTDTNNYYLVKQTCLTPTHLRTFYYCSGNGFIVYPP